MFEHAQQCRLFNFSAAPGFPYNDPKESVTKGFVLADDPAWNEIVPLCRLVVSKPKEYAILWISDDQVD